MGVDVDKREPVRILHLGSPAGMYGAERWILALVRHLPPARFESIVGVIIDEPGSGEAPLCAQAADDGFRTVQFTAYGRVSWSAAGQLRRFIRDEGIDVIHTHGYKTDLIGRLATIGTACRNVVTPHGWSRDAGVRLQCYELLDRMSFPFMDAVVPLSADLRDGLARWPGLSRRMRVIRNCVDLSELDETSATGDETVPRRREGDVVVGYIGQLIPRKGVGSLIRAFADADIPAGRLWIVGDGPECAGLEALARDLDGQGRIEFLGFRLDRIALLRQFDVIVLPSSLEGIPRCLMEAMGAGVAVIASDIPGCNDLVTSGETGLLFDYGDVDALRDALRAVSGDREERARMADNGKRLVHEQYSAQSMAAQYGDLYEALMSGEAIADGASRAGASR